MRTYAHKSISSRKRVATKVSLNGQSHFNGNDRLASILDLQRTIGNKAVQRLIESNIDDTRSDSSDAETSGYHHLLNPIGNYLKGQTRLETKEQLNSQSDPVAQDEYLSGTQKFESKDVSQLLKRGFENDMRGDGDEDEADIREGHGIVQQQNDSPADSESCSASATGVSLGDSGPINDGTRYGLRTPIIVRGTELVDVLDSELVGTSIDHTGSMESRPSSRSNNSGFMPADNIPDDRHRSSISDHLSYFDDHGGDGSYSRLQMDLYKIPSCNIDEATSMPNSGYRIKREVKAEGDKVVGIITKTAEAVTIGSHSTTEGLTAKKEAKVTLRE